MKGTEHATCHRAAGTSPVLYDGGGSCYADKTHGRNALGNNLANNGWPSMFPERRAQAGQQWRPYTVCRAA